MLVVEMCEICYNKVMDRNRVPTQPGEAVPVTRVSEAEPKKQGKQKKIRKPLSKLRKISIAVLVVGILALAGGAGFLVYKLTRTPGANDAEFLVEVGEWQREGEPSVVWDFTEIGKGTLSTNGGENEYDFAWAFEDGKLKIDTDWLYTLNDEYEFSLDQEARSFELKSEDETIKFVEK